MTRRRIVIEIYEIPYSTTIEVILDKVAELVKAGKVKEISDMRDETDLSGLKLTIDLKRGVDPDKLMQKLYQADALAGHLQLQLQHPHRRDAPGAWECERSAGGVDRMAHGVRASGGCTSSSASKKEKLHLLLGPEAASCWTSTRPSPSSGRRRRRPRSSPT